MFLIASVINFTSGDGVHLPRISENRPNVYGLITPTLLKYQIKLEILLQDYFIVFFGAGLGGVTRYWGSNFVYKFLPVTFPYGTLAVNILGSFIIGFVMYYLDTNQLISQQLRTFLTVGLCGGLTTFSTFSFETINLLKEREFLFAGLNILSNIIITLIVLFIAYKLSKLLSGV